MKNSVPAFLPGKLAFVVIIGQKLKKCCSGLQLFHVLRACFSRESLFTIGNPSGLKAFLLGSIRLLRQGDSLLS